MSSQPPVLSRDTVQTSVRSGVTNGAVASNGAAEPRGEPTAPIEPNIWLRYSPNHEFPLSVLLTFVLYFFIALMVAVLGVVVFNFFSAGEPPELDNITFAGGGGDPSGDRSSDVNYGPQDAIEFNDTPLDTPTTNELDLIKPTEDRPRLIEEAQKRENDFKKNSYGLGGPGTGGGKGAGHGTGIGDGRGPGVQSAREKRKDRWVLTFKYSSGDEYLQNLANLGAIVVISEGAGKYRIFDDLSKRPLTGRSGNIEDVRKLNRIYWRDTNPEATHALAAALGLSAAPSSFWAFFPVELEKELFAKELAYRGLTEEQIIERKLETFFEVERRGGKFVVVVQSQQKRSGR